MSRKDKAERIRLLQSGDFWGVWGGWHSVRRDSKCIRSRVKIGLDPVNGKGKERSIWNSPQISHPAPCSSLSAGNKGKEKQTGVPASSCHLMYQQACSRPAFPVYEESCPCGHPRPALLPKAFTHTTLSPALCTHATRPAPPRPRPDSSTCSNAHLKSKTGQKSEKPLLILQTHGSPNWFSCSKNYLYYCYLLTSHSYLGQLQLGFQNHHSKEIASWNFSGIKQSLSCS